MAKKPFKGDYLTFQVRLSYDENTDSVHLTSKDKDILAENGFDLVLNGGWDTEEAEMTLRTLLEKRGLLSEERFKSIPSRVLYDESSNQDVWDKFPLGVHSNGEEAVWDSSYSPSLMLIGGSGSGKSVLQRNILSHCIRHSDKWGVLLIDPLRVEFAPYKKHTETVMEIANSVAESVGVLRDVHGEMMKRYEEMEKQGCNNFLDMSEPPKSLLVMIDESNLFLAPVESMVQEHLDEDKLRLEAVKVLQDITRLGRAAGIHVVISSQRLDTKVINGEMLQHFPTRIATGPLNSEQSQLLLGNNQATRLNSAVKGWGYLQDHGRGVDFQGYYSERDYLRF